MVIKIENCSKKFGGNYVLNDINLTFESGHIYGIVGLNGSGKTMLLRMISGLISPTSGKVFIDEKQLHKDMSFPPDMGIIIEKPEMLNHLSGLENLKLLSEIRGVISQDKIIDYMKMFSLDPQDKKPMKKYSLGMKQKIGIIQATMEDPQLLVLDEPFNALDEATVNMVRSLLLKYKEEGKLIIITSHHREDIEALCDEIVHLENGQIVKKAKVDTA